MSGGIQLGVCVRMNKSYFDISLTFRLIPIEQTALALVTRANSGFVQQSRMALPLTPFCTFWSMPHRTPLLLTRVTNRASQHNHIFNVGLSSN